MNHLKLLFFAFIVLGLSTTSCNKDDGDSDPSDRSNYFFCKLDGNDWEAVGIDQPTISASVTGSSASKRLDFFGSNPAGLTISVIVQDYENAETGECLSENTYYGVDHEKAGDNFTATSGEMNFARLTVTGADTSKDGFVRITNCADGKISGSFEFVVTDLAGTLVHTVSEGSFENVEYSF
ncbi:MAG: hypothetical protein ACI9RM_001426 [Ulvibacter sp.]|jgi:hypothetical protein